MCRSTPEQWNSIKILLLFQSSGGNAHSRQKVKAGGCCLGRWRDGDGLPGLFSFISNAHTRSYYCMRSFSLVGLFFTENNVQCNNPYCQNARTPCIEWFEFLTCHYASAVSAFIFTPPSCHVLLPSVSDVILLLINNIFCVETGCSCELVDSLVLVGCYYYFVIVVVGVAFFHHAIRRRCSQITVANRNDRQNSSENQTLEALTYGKGQRTK